MEVTTNSKTQWITQACLMLFFQGILFGSIFICIYALLTYNTPLIIFLGIVSFLQSFAKRSQTVISLVNKYIHPIDYFRSFKRIYQEQIPQDQLTLIGFHPHGVLPYCLAANMNADDSKISKLTGLGSRALLNLPFIGFQLRLWGVQSVDSKNILKLMKQKRKTIALTPGGFQQATLTTPKEIRIFIKNRKGFIKYALEYGYTIRPILAFNQHKAFWTLDIWPDLRLWINKFKIPTVIFGGGFLWGFLPLNLDMVTIVGKGFKRNPENEGKQISKEEVDYIHRQYIKQLERMHSKYQDQYKEEKLVFY